jgi:putative ABC transport system permease protein
MVDGGTRYYQDKVIVSDASMAGGAFSSAPLSIATIPDIEAAEGVARASAGVFMLLDDEQGMSMGVPQMLVGSDDRARGYESFALTVAKGRDLLPDDRGTTVLGTDLARALDAEVGKTVIMRGREFEVVGIYDKTLTAPDNTAAVPLADAQELLFEGLPAMVQTQIASEQLATSITAYPEPGVDPDLLAGTIEAQVSGVKASGPQVFMDQFESGTRIFNSIIFGVALVALLVGGLSVVNTMIMAVSERTREIGIRKAIGASRGQIVRQFLAESTLIGFLGGASGLLLGWLATLGVNAVMGSSGTILFLVTGRLALGSLLFAIVLGISSGLYPSLHASRLRPVVALRYE